MHRLNYVLWLLLGLAVIALFQIPGPAAQANSKTCETVTERRCDLKGNCKDKTYESCTGLSGPGNPGKSVSPRNAPPRTPAKSLSK